MSKDLEELMQEIAGKPEDILAEKLEIVTMQVEPYSGTKYYCVRTHVVLPKAKYYIDLNVDIVHRQYYSNRIYLS